ncbi:MAG: 2-C-methyl-D-erythritol 4-phosphate cytidylyltransferase [Solirubrobacterales bacterium]
MPGGAVALVVAAGRGERLGSQGPKAFVTVAGRPMLDWSIEALRAAPGIGEIVVALPAGAAPPGGVTAAEGGETRSESVRNALAAVTDRDAGVVLVHDAARPLLTAGMVADCLAALNEDGGWDAAVAAAPVSDTVKRAPDGRAVTETLDRSELWAVQTPQVFRREALAKALDAAPEALASATDDAMLVEQAGGRVRVVASRHPNPKVTTPDDLALAAQLLAGG